MEAYVDCNYYTYKYLLGREAVIDAASFPFYALKASQEIRRYAGHNLDESNLPDRVKMCCCEVAELLYSSEKRTAESGVGTISESIGSWSRSYESGEAAARVLRGKIHDAIYAWLAGTGLLYLGR